MRMKAASTGGSDEAVPVRKGRADSGYVPVRDERIQIGHSVTTVQTAYKTNQDGERTLVDINIGATVVP